MKGTKRGKGKREKKKPLFDPFEKKKPKLDELKVRVSAHGACDSNSASTRKRLHSLLVQDTV